MELDAKQRVLIAIYTEYQKDIFNMERVNAKDLCIESEVFFNSILKLQNEGYILWAKIYKGMENKIVNVSMQSVLITSKGIEYVEDKLQIKTTDSNKEKVEKVVTKVSVVILDKGLDFFSKVLAEIIGKKIGV